VGFGGERSITLGASPTVLGRRVREAAFVSGRTDTGGTGGRDVRVVDAREFPSFSRQKSLARLGPAGGFSRGGLRSFGAAGALVVSGRRVGSAGVREFHLYRRPPAISKVYASERR
jgi:hypothetical protein